MAKAAIRNLLAQSSRVAGFLSSMERESTAHLNVLCYHRILPSAEKAAYFSPDLVVTPEAFRKHCETLAKHYHVLPVSEAMALKPLVKEKQWEYLESRVAANTRRTLDFLDQFGHTATFFILGRIADEMPELVREIVDRGHEVASKGYEPRDLHEMSRNAFREDVLKTHNALENATGLQVMGHRVAKGHLGTDDTWVKSYESPFNMYFHVWELDPDLPKIASAGWLRRIRQYRNLRRMPEILGYYLEHYRFESIASFLDLKLEKVDEHTPVERAPEAVRLPISKLDGNAAQPQELEPVTVIVPCFNEERVLPYLARVLDNLRLSLGKRYAILIAKSFAKVAT
ncbi:MAG: polysaccharide deacetylase family protein [Planctomycetota bacterium]|nr:polysaccharide deacetylase family protein [Planctomycetota bacterium]MDA1113679.1 polysaccharide deacetylase family protein [Planctomycetota bacterium]